MFSCSSTSDLISFLFLVVILSKNQIPPNANDIPINCPGLPTYLEINDCPSMNSDCNTTSILCSYNPSCRTMFHLAYMPGESRPFGFIVIINSSPGDNVTLPEDVVILSNGPTNSN